MKFILNKCDIINIDKYQENIPQKLLLSLKRCKISNIYQLLHTKTFTLKMEIKQRTSDLVEHTNLNSKYYGLYILSTWLIRKRKYGNVSPSCNVKVNFKFSLSYLSSFIQSFNYLLNGCQLQNEQCLSI